LKELHWLRIIIDEGHEFSSATSNAVLVAQKFVTADRRWVVSGTPARDRLFGIEVDLAADVDDGIEEQHGDYSRSEPSTPQSTSLSVSSSSIRYAALEQRKAFKKEEEASGAAKSIGVLAANFLQVRPWAHNETNLRKADWDDYIYRHKSYRGRTYSSFSRCLRQTLGSLVVKTQPDDVERDIVLPPLTHKVIRLEPSFYDKLTANLFNLVLTGNAVTSERTDVDYLFHKSSAKPRFQLITNLRHSNFFWTGFSVDDVLSVIDHGTGYLEKDDIHCNYEDRQLLRSCLGFARHILTVPGWCSLSRYHELAVFVDDFPEDAKKPWALTDDVEPMMIGASQLNQAQNLVNCQLFDENPLQGLAATGESVLKALSESTIDEKTKSSSTNSKLLQGVPTSGVKGEPLASRRHTIPSPKKPSIKAAAPSNPSNPPPPHPISPPKLSRKRKRSLDNRDLPKESLLAIPSIVGTVSAKLSYLLDQITSLYESEKILIFYDGNNTAFYIAQCLDLLHIKYLIYAKSLSSQQRSKYIVSFDADNSIRVLLMDIRCGAYGLNVNKASRVFFINPVCSPSAEAQAIKRSHRIGQDKPVHVETLVLKGTIEEAIFERSKNMTRSEHLEATQLSDDRGVAAIIQNARALPVSLEEGVGRAQMASLSKPIQIFGRKGRGDTNIRGIDLGFEDEGGNEAKKRKQAPRKPPKKSKANASSSSDTTGKRIPQPLSTPSIDVAAPSDLTVQAESASERVTTGVFTEGMPSVPTMPTDAFGQGSLFG
jgi:hypothetical protein